MSIYLFVWRCRMIPAGKISGIPNVKWIGREYKATMIEGKRNLEGIQIFQCPITSMPCPCHHTSHYKEAWDSQPPYIRQHCLIMSSDSGGNNCLRIFAHYAILFPSEIYIYIYIYIYKHIHKFSLISVRSVRVVWHI